MACGKHEGGFEKASEARARVRRVFYPAAGYDAATPFILFPEAEEIVVIDPVRFQESKSKIADAEFGSQRLGNFILSAEVSERESVAGILVTRLSHVVPGFRLRGITVSQHKQHEFYNQIGTIEFDSGEGTKLRKYIHVQGATEEPWLSMATAKGFDAMIVKGLEVGLFVSDENKANLYKILRDRKGILIEDDQHFTSKLGVPDKLPGTVRTFLGGPFGHGSANVVMFGN